MVCFVRTQALHVVVDCGGLQVQLLFTTRVCYQPAPDLQEAHLLFVRYYIAAPDQQLSVK